MAKNPSEKMQQLDSSHSTSTDTSRLTSVIQKHAEEDARLEAERVKHENSLKSVKLNAGDVERIMKEFDVSKTTAERLLRESGGNLDSAIAKVLA
jgi:NACalpha-BTF3-like transcription factor